MKRPSIPHERSRPLIFGYPDMDYAVGPCPDTQPLPHGRWGKHETLHQQRIANLTNRPNTEFTELTEYPTYRTDQFSVHELAMPTDPTHEHRIGQQTDTVYHVSNRTPCRHSCSCIESHTQQTRFFMYRIGQQNNLSCHRHETPVMISSNVDKSEKICEMFT